MLILNAHFNFNYFYLFLVYLKLQIIDYSIYLRERMPTTIDTDDEKTQMQNDEAMVKILDQNNYLEELNRRSKYIEFTHVYASSTYLSLKFKGISLNSYKQKFNCLKKQIMKKQTS